MIKNELIASILEVFEAQNDSQMNEKINAKELKDGISLVKKYEVF